MMPRPTVSAPGIPVPARGPALALALALMVPMGAAAVQAPPEDTVRASLSTADVRALFGDRSFLSTAEVVQPTVPRPEVEAIFRSRLEVAIASGGGVLDANGFSLVVTGLGEFADTMVQRVAGNDTVVAFALTGPGDYDIAVDGLDAPCIVPPVPPVSLFRGMTARARVELDCLQPPSLTVVSDRGTSPFGSPSVRLAGSPELELAAGSTVELGELRSGPNELRLSIPAREPRIGGLEVTFPGDRPDSVYVTLDPFDGERMGPNDTISFPTGDPGPINLTLNVLPPPPSPPPGRATLVAVEVKGDGAESLDPGDVRIQLGDGEPQDLLPRVTARFDSIAGDSLLLTVDLKTVGSGRDGWYLAPGLGAIAVAATDAKSFITPTVGLSLVKGRERAEWLHLNAQFGYWRAGPSSPDPVLPENPRPAYRNRTIWTWALGASLFPGGWGGLGVSASWVEGRETASQEEKYINRSRGVAVGPRFRLFTDSPWPSVIFGLDAQYGEADELLLAEPEWGWSLTPVLSLSYVLR